MYDVQMYDVRRMYDVQMYDLRGGQSSIQEKHTREDVFFSSFLHYPFLHKLYILHCSFVHFFCDFSLFSCVYEKKAVSLQRKDEVLK